MSNAQCKGGKMTGGHALAQMLQLCGIGPMFGMGGFQMLPFYEGIRALGMEHYLITDENNGALAADAYARITGRSAICDGTTGPGAANLATGLIESLNAGVPVIAVVGDTHRAHSWKNMTQEARQMELLRPCVKELIRVDMAGRIPELVRRAFALATSGRPGPVLLDLPEDVMHGEHGFTPEDFYVNERVLAAPSLRCRPAADNVAAAARMLAKAKRPMILAGGGVHLSQAQQALNEFAEAFAIPVAYTMSGKGVVADTSELSVGLFGRYSRIANDLMEQADCLFVVGCKLGEIASKRYELPKAGTPVIHLDIMPEEIERWAKTTVALWGDAREALLELGPVLREKLDGPISRSDYFAEIKKRKADWPEVARVRYESNEAPINMGRMMAELNTFMPEDGVLIVDGGFAAHWGALLYDTKSVGRTFVANRGFASIGYGIPACIGVSLAVRRGGLNGTVVGVTGDGGLNMSIGELDTAMRAKTPFILLVVNNAASGYVRALQHAFYGEGHYQSSAITDTDFAAVARSYGCHGIRVEKPEELQGALRQAANNRDKPTVVDVVVTRDPGQMLPAADNRALAFREGDRPV